MFDWNGPTPPLEEFLEAYRADDNEWWHAPSGHHMNLFDEAIESIDALKADNARLKEQEEFLETENQRLRESILDLHLVIQELRHEGL